MERAVKVNHEEGTVTNPPLRVLLRLGLGVRVLFLGGGPPRGQAR